MKVKVISDGTSFGTYVVDVETGERLEDVTAVKWEIDPRRDMLCRVTLEMGKIPVELEADADDMSVVIPLPRSLERKMKEDWFSREGQPTG